MNRKFSLIELLVVIAIIGILASIILPVLGNSRESAIRTSCKNKIKHSTLANLMYADDNQQTVFTTTNGQSKWNKSLFESGYLSDSGLKTDNHPFHCPKGVSFTWNYESNYSMNYKLTWAGGSNTPASLQASNASKTVFLMDGYNKNNVLWRNHIRGTSGIDKVLKASSEMRIARHDGKLNISYIDGHIETMNGTQILNIGNSFQTSNEFWTP
jgi:prepilin-type N-terminal cleavage/methylation domain-containing protein/prepilin-type processing-associated H-X9-DG protein